MKISEDRILTSHAGSLIKPPNLIEPLQEKDFGRPINQEQFDADLTNAVNDVVRKQEEVGIDIPDDGEMSKTIWTGYHLERLTSVEVSETPGGIPLGAGEPQFADFWKQYRGHAAPPGARRGNWPARPRRGS